MATAFEAKIDEAAKPQPKSQLELLQMVEQGEITVEEAVKLMKEL